MTASCPRDIRKFTFTNPLKIKLNWRSITLLLGDVVSLGVAWQAALYINRIFFTPPVPKLDWGEFAGFPLLFWLVAGAVLWTFASQHFYRRDQEHNFVHQAQSLSNVYLLSLIVSYFYDPKLDAPRSLFVPAWLGSIGAVVFTRLLLSLWLDRLHIGKNTCEVWLIADSGRQGELKAILEGRAACRVVGITDSLAVQEPDLWQTIIQAGVQEVIAESLPNTQLVSQMYWQFRHAGITLRLLPSSLAMLHRRGTTEIYAGLPTIRIDPQLLAGWEYACKRIIDRVGALLGLVCLAPLFILIAIAIQVTSRGSAFYSQERVGLHGRVFRMWKFRTMYQEAEELLPQLEAQAGTTEGALFKLVDDPRVTPIGKFLRRTSLDELPQLVNVLWGQMSLVGPRPFSLADVAKFAEWHHYRHIVIPGITGLWQVSGRSDLSNLDDVVNLDLFYIYHWSLNLDIELLLETVKIVLFGKGAY